MVEEKFSVFLAWIGVSSVQRLLDCHLQTAIQARSKKGEIMNTEVIEAMNGSIRSY